MRRNRVNLGTPIDYLIETDEHLVACGYEFRGDTRTGALYFLNKETLDVLLARETSGTLQASFNDGTLYVANAADVYAFIGFDVVARHDTPALNTCIFVDDNVYVGSTNGSISIFDKHLSKKAEVALSNDPIWAVKVLSGILYAGDEAGRVFVYDILEGAIAKVHEKRLGIIDIFRHKGCIAVSSYDEDLVLYDPDTLKAIGRCNKVGALWKTVQRGKFIVSSCIYQGLRIFDSQFRLLKTIDTETICYAVCCMDTKLVWAPYYSGYIEWIEFDCDGQQNMDQDW